MSDCLFCTLIANPKPGMLLHDDADVVAMKDIHPQAPTHLLVLPRKHFADLTEMEGSLDVVKKMYAATLKLAKEHKLEAGFRTVMNVKAGGGQSVFHVHMHLLGGRRMGAGLAG